jgi:hypothetical protein
MTKQTVNILSWALLGVGIWALWKEYKHWEGQEQFWTKEAERLKPKGDSP